MTPAQVIEKFRVAADDNAAPYLWSDAELIGYLDRAQTEFVRTQGGIPDTTRVRVSPRQEEIKIPANLLKIKQVRDLTNNRDLTLTSHENAAFPTDDYSSEYTGLAPELILGEKEGYLVFNDPPNASLDLKIYYLRLPCDEITSVRSRFEVAEQHHHTLLLHTLFQAYSKQDADAHDPRLAGRYFSEFTSEAARAREEKGRLEHVPRTIRYGGI